MGCSVPSWEYFCLCPHTLCARQQFIVFSRLVGRRALSIKTVPVLGLVSLPPDTADAGGTIYELVKESYRPD